MPGLEPGIQRLVLSTKMAWMAGTSPAMTTVSVRFAFRSRT